jgi:hypothetical protein
VGLKLQVALMPTFSNDELRRFEKRWASPSSDDSLNDADPRPLSSLRTAKERPARGVRGVADSVAEKVLLGSELNATFVTKVGNQGGVGYYK